MPLFRTRRTLVALAAVAAVVGGLSVASAGAAPAPNPAPGVPTTALPASAKAHLKPLDPKLPATGQYAFLLQLTAPATAGHGQLNAVNAAQAQVIAALPAGSQVLYKTHALLAGVAVRTDVSNYSALLDMSGVSAVYPIAVKKLSNNYAVPLQGAPQVWSAYGDLGQHSTIAVIDTGIDYTHANFGGVGTVADYQAAKAQNGKPVSPHEFPGPKVVGGYDLVGDAYNPNDPADGPIVTTPSPDPYPLDCSGHGSHVAGSAAGFGENANGSTYAGPYNPSTPFSTMKIGPGMAPKAKLIAFKAFGCNGGTDFIGDAIDMAADPNGDGDTSDHVDVVNMSLGSNFASPEDGDAVVTNAASALGVTMVVAAGNGSDVYDAAGSPGAASRAFTVAASVDASDVLEGLDVSAPASIAGRYDATRSTAYDWAHQPDLVGTVVRVSDPNNLDACDPLRAADRAAVAGHIAFVEWSDTDALRRCGSLQRADNLTAAGATGFIFGDDAPYIFFGIFGNADIPGVLVAKAGADAIRRALEAGRTLTIGGTVTNGFDQVDPDLDDTVAFFSSRGIGDAGNVKPDVTAVGDTVFSTDAGTGDGGFVSSGTSMAAPMAAGAAALVHDQHLNWSPEQVKADIMNTADQDLFTDPNHQGTKFAPERVGAGRIDAKAALDNSVLAYNADDAGSVSVSFGPIDAAGRMTLSKRIKLQNTGTGTKTYHVAVVDRTQIPGAAYSVSPTTVTVPGGSSATVKITLTVNASQLTKTVDPTVAALQDGLPRQFQADASGLVMFTAGSGPTLRVPVYAAPRPVSKMTQASSLTLPSGNIATSQLALTGNAFNQGSGTTLTRSLVAGFELQGTSGAARNCTATVTTRCVSFPDERDADLKYVGTTSDAPQLRSIGHRPLQEGLAYFALTTQGPWRTPVGTQTYEIWIDGDGDGVADAVLVNSRLTNDDGSPADVLITELIDLKSDELLDVEALNDSLGDTDTAIFNSDSLVLPVAIGAIPGVTAHNSRIGYVVEAFSGYESTPVDTFGHVNENTGRMTQALSFDVLNPGISVQGSFNGDASAILYRDAPGSSLTLTRNASAYADDDGLGLLMLHFQNANGSKAQVVSLN